MKLLLEQLFYGRGERGYDVLGASPGGLPFAHRVEALCDGVGTPSVGYAGEPILLSVPEGDRVIMICGHRGISDPMGRDTLFFHALVSSRKDLNTARANAFALFDQGAFGEKMAGPSVDAVQLDFKTIRDDGKNGITDGLAVGASLPAIVRSGKPEPELVRSALGNRANELAWATFGFSGRDDFDLLVLPAGTAVSSRYSEFDATGRPLMGTRRVTVPSASSLTRSGDSQKKASVGEPVSRAAGRNNSIAFRLSFAVNVLLAIACAALAGGRKTQIPVETDEKPKVVSLPAVVVTNFVPALVSSEQTNEIRRLYLEELVRDFPAEKRIKDYSKEIGSSSIPLYDQIRNENFKQYEKTRSFLAKIETYVKTLNEILLRKENSNENESSN